LRRLIGLAVSEHDARGDAIFAAGWSNGGYLTTLLASSADPPLRGIAPIAGHDYDLPRLQTQGAAVLLQMSYDDEMVRYTGCCHGAGCCCNIDKDRGQGVCVGAEAVAARYREVNKCKGEARRVAAGAAECWVGAGCATATVFCAWHRISHTGMGSSRSLCSAVRFFASLLGEDREVCQSSLLDNVLLGSFPHQPLNSSAGSRSDTTLQQKSTNTSRGTLRPGATLRQKSTNTSSSTLRPGDAGIATLATSTNGSTVWIAGSVAAVLTLCLCKLWRKGGGASDPTPSKGEGQVVGAPLD